MNKEIKKLKSDLVKKTNQLKKKFNLGSLSTDKAVYTLLLEMDELEVQPLIFLFVPFFCL